MFQRSQPRVFRFGPSIQQRLDRCPRDRDPGLPLVSGNLSVLGGRLRPRDVVGRHSFCALPQSLARAGNRDMAPGSQDFANEEKIGQQGAEMAGRVQVVDELRADRRLG